MTLRGVVRLFMRNSNRKRRGLVVALLVSSHCECVGAMPNDKEVMIVRERMKF
jgi:hypothetical protein